jgi:hypothetical protein
MAGAAFERSVPLVCKRQKTGLWLGEDGQGEGRRQLSDRA